MPRLGSRVRIPSPAPVFPREKQAYAKAPSSGAFLHFRPVPPNPFKPRNGRGYQFAESTGRESVASLWCAAMQQGFRSATNSCLLLVFDRIVVQRIELQEWTCHLTNTQRTCSTPGVGARTQSVRCYKTGWDYLAEFANNPYDGPAEAAPAPLCAFVQVKSSDQTILSMSQLVAAGGEQVRSE